MELEGWQYNLQQRLLELRRDGRDFLTIAVPLGCEPTAQDLAEADEIIVEAGFRALSIQPDGVWLAIEVG